MRAAFFVAGRDLPTWIISSLPTCQPGPAYGATYETIERQSLPSHSIKIVASCVAGNEKDLGYTGSRS
jgi:hypothetical protein